MTGPGSREDPRHSVTVPYRARFDECGPDGRVRSSAILRYAQDLAWIHSERLGFGREWYAERNLAWVVRAVELGVLAPIALGTTVRLTTRVSGFRKVWARRRTDGVDGDGVPVLWAHTDWVMTDTVRGAPGRVPPEFPDVFEVPPGGFEPGRVPLPPAPSRAHRHATRVRHQDIDPMGHVNNAAYVDYLEETLLAAGPDAARLVAAVPRRIRIEYVAPATPGSELVGETWAVDDGAAGWAWRLLDGGGRELVRARVDRGG